MNERDGHMVRHAVPNESEGAAALSDGAVVDAHQALPAKKTATGRRAVPAPEVLIFLSTLAAAGTLALAALRLTGVIAWPWLWVLSPAWVLFAAVVLFSLAFAGAAAYAAMAARTARRPGGAPRGRK